jgi:hypothetical protein
MQFRCWQKPWVLSLWVLGLSLGSGFAWGERGQQPGAEGHPPVESQIKGAGAPEQPEDSAPRKPLKRRARAGLAGFASRSTLTFVKRPDLPSYSLEVVHVFPERVRWRLEPMGETRTSAQRLVRFQFGAGIWMLPQYAECSTLHRGEEARRFQLQNELRRVAMSWPAGLAWRATDKPEVQLAKLPGLGSLRAVTRGDDTRPLRIDSYFGADTASFESLAQIEWKRAERRWWPASWTLFSGKRRIWDEVISEVKTGSKYLDSFFLPADRRVSTGPASAPRALRLGARVTRQTPLAPDLAWPEVLALAKEAAGEAARTLPDGLQLDPRPIYLLDPAGLPVAFELRLRGEGSSVPEGWRQTPAAEGWSTVHHGLGEIRKPAIEALERMLQPGQRPSRPYVRVQHTGGQVGLVQLVLKVASQ